MHVLEVDKSLVVLEVLVDELFLGNCLGLGRAIASGSQQLFA